MAIAPPALFSPPLPLRFEWDESNQLQHFYFLPEPLHDRLLALTHTANFALAIGAAEWIATRLQGFGLPTEARAFLAAAWADLVPGWHCLRYYPPDDDWRGPVNGPMAMATAILLEAMQGREDNPELADRAVWMDNLARHVIEPLQPYDQWFEATVSRLLAHHSWAVEGRPVPGLFDDDFPQGGPVPPEALMPDLPYDPGQAQPLLERHVNRQRRDGNPFVLDDQEWQ